MTTKNNIRILPTSGEVHPDAILEAAKNVDLDKVVVLGWDKDGDLFFSSSCGLLRDIDWLLGNGKDALWNMMRNQNRDDG